MDGATGATGSPGLIGWQGTKGTNGETGATGTLNLGCVVKFPTLWLFDNAGEI